MRNFLWLLAVVAVSLLSSPPSGRSEVVFQIGTKDQAFTEFSRDRQSGKPVVYKVGKSTAQDWYAYQPGTFDYEVGRSIREEDWMTIHPGSSRELASDPVPVPFQVEFDLPHSPQGTYILELDAIFRYQKPASPWYGVEINGHPGHYRLAPRPAPELWWRVGPALDQFVGYQSLEMRLPAAYFRPGLNRLTLRCEDGFGIYYDALSLRQEPATTPRVITASVEPTVFYKNRPAGLVELSNVLIRTSRPLGRASVQVQVGKTRLGYAFEQTGFGDVCVPIEVPAAGRSLPVSVYLNREKAPVYRGEFEPQRRWNVYAMPMEQADFGYDEVPPRTLEWNNRYIDRALDIADQFPSYSFTLDVAANLESYLATRDEKQGKRLVEYLRNGRFGINALYENFFTGLATPEELVHMVEYAPAAGRRYGFTVDSASQTDEPSVTGALPQILADAGVKYYADGSDPIRGPFNPIGLLNLQSPFYWEAPNGSKVLTSSCVHYIGVKDLTWEGWNRESAKSGVYKPSVFGLEHSLPLYLSLYSRQDYAFDAVLLYGLHDDEDPIRHFGEADIMDLWNREYAYPRIIPGTQRDYFQYVAGHFASQIRTYRGDGGAYWEDEAGSDARIAALNRESQMRIQAAEKLESVANWLQPRLRFDYAPYLAAWKNLLLADCYVWSDAQSFHRPESYRTRMGEAVHRAWANAAQQQSWDLRLTAMDRVAELIATDAPGAVVFNAESWTRSGFFDFELEPDEVLQDPASGQDIPCGVLRLVSGYQETRCWAADVPPTGYKYYAIRKGKLSSPESTTLDNSAAWVEGKFYRLQLDSATGAIAHLIDKSTGEEVVNARSGYGMNEYLYVTGGDEANGHSNRLLVGDPTLPVAQLTIHPAEVAGKPVMTRYPWGARVTVHAKAPNTPEIISNITLNDEQRTIGFENEVDKTTTMKKEAVYFAFPLAVREPRVEFQAATAWVDAVNGMLPGANREWFTTQGGVRAVGANQSVDWASVDAPLITLQDINRGLWPTSMTLRNANVFSYAMNNYWQEDAPARQGGHFVFRYALTSGRESSMAGSSQLTAEQRSPLVVLRHEHKGWKQSLPPAGAGFLASSPSGVVVLTARPGPDPSSYLVRVHNTTDQNVAAHLQFPRTEIADAYLASALGDRIGTVDRSGRDLSFPMARFDLKTVVVQVTPGGPAF